MHICVKDSTQICDCVKRRSFVTESPSSIVRFSVTSQGQVVQSKSSITDLILHFEALSKRKLRNTFEIFPSNVKLGQVVEFGNDVQKVVSVHDTTFEEATGNSDITKIIST